MSVDIQPTVAPTTQTTPPTTIDTSAEMETSTTTGSAAPMAKEEEPMVHAGTRIGLKRDRTTTYATIGFEHDCLGLSLGGGGPTIASVKESLLANERAVKQARTTETSVVTITTPTKTTPSNYLYSLAGELLFGALPVCVISVECNLLDCNNSFLQLFGYPRAEMLTMNLFQLSHNNEIKEVFGMMEKLIEIAAKLGITKALTKELDTPTAGANGSHVSQALHTYERTCVTSEGISKRLHWTVWLTRSTGEKPVFLCTMTPSASPIPATTTPSSSSTTTPAQPPVASTVSSSPPALEKSVTPTPPTSAFARPANRRYSVSSTPILSPTTPSTTSAVAPVTIPAATPSTIPTTTTAADLSALSVLSELAAPAQSSTDYQQHLQQQQVQAQAAHAQAIHAQAVAAQQQHQQQQQQQYMMSSYATTTPPTYYPSQPYLSVPPPPTVAPTLGMQQQHMMAQQQAAAHYNLQQHQQAHQQRYQMMVGQPMFPAPTQPPSMYPSTTTPYLSSPMKSAAPAPVSAMAAAAPLLSLSQQPPMKTV